MSLHGGTIFVVLSCFALCRPGTTSRSENSSDASDFDLNFNFFDRGIPHERNSSLSSIFKIAKNPVNATGDDPVSVLKKENDNFANLFKIYNVGLIGQVWFKRNRQLTNGCRRNMNVFLEALDKYELWALKVLDASGRYTNGFFWGNNYWMGSETLCNNIGFKRRHYSSTGVMPNGVFNYTELDKEPPFSLGFFKIKAEIHLPKLLAPRRTILIGLCAPYSCNEEDVRHILNMSLPGGTNNRTDVKILEIRAPQNTYYFWKDKTFWIVFGVTLVVSLLLVTGTLYDIFRERRYKKVYQSRIRFTEKYLRGENEKIGLEHALTCKSKSMMRNGINATDGVGRLDGNSNTLDLTEESSTNSEPNLDIWQKVLLSFSIKENIKTICERTVSPDTLPTIHGLKALSMIWVILGHTCIVIFKYSDNMEFRSLTEKEFFFQAVTNGAFSVDTFFFISGLLVSFLYFRTTAKIDINRLIRTKGIKAKIIQFVGLIAYRYGRLTAPYLFILGVVEISMKSFYYNSVFDSPTLDHENCPNFWWRNALYINTLYPVKEMCMLWSWYLSDDTQFYILGIVLLILAVSHIKTAAVLVAFFLGSSWLTTAYVAYSNQHLPSEDDPLALFDKIYDKPWTRLGPYLIGMTVGWILFKTDCKIKMNKCLVVLGWLLSLSGLLTLVYGLYEAKLDLITSSAYSSLSHSAWAIALAWIVIACATGYGGYVNKLLSSSILYPFSRVTYCAYLVHPLVIRYMVIHLDSPLHLNKEIVMFLFFGQIVASYILSFVVSLAFEAPVVSLLRIISPRKSARNVG